MWDIEVKGISIASSVVRNKWVCMYIYIYIYMYVYIYIRFDFTFYVEAQKHCSLHILKIVILGICPLDTEIDLSSKLKRLLNVLPCLKTQKLYEFDRSLLLCFVRAIKESAIISPKSIR